MKKILILLILNKINAGLENSIAQKYIECKRLDEYKDFPLKHIDHLILQGHFRCANFKINQILEKNLLYHLRKFMEEKKFIVNSITSLNYNSDININPIVIFFIDKFDDENIRANMISFLEKAISSEKECIVDLIIKSIKIYISDYNSTKACKRAIYLSNKRNYTRYSKYNRL